MLFTFRQNIKIIFFNLVHDFRSVLKLSIVKGVLTLHRIICKISFRNLVADFKV